MINKYLSFFFSGLFLFSLTGKLEAQTTFSYTGTVQTYTVPAGVTAIAVDVWGAQGAGVACASTYQSVGGCGGRVQTNIAVTPGQVLNLVVGQQPLNTAGAGGFGGGGTDNSYSAVWPGTGGGGATTIIDNSTGDSLVVSGGGGGGGGDFCTAPADDGGPGGGLIGGAGNSNACGIAAGGQGGTQIAGGLSTVCTGDAGGTAGIAGKGGSYTGAQGAGGGGGGYWGGGAGTFGSGGGGGSSYTHPVYDFLVTHTQGYNGTGCAVTLSNGQTIITPLCSAGTISGPSFLCLSGTATYSISGSGGSWSSANTAIATIDAVSGLVTPVAVGTTVIYYTSGVCVSTFIINIITLPQIITGTFSLCANATTSLADATPGGSWSSSIPGDATIDPALGVVTGISAGTPNITYTAAGGCFVTTPFTVNPNPSTITGPSSICQGATATLTNILSGGTWSSGTPAVATIDPASGLITGISGFGISTITYSITATGCFTTTTDTVQPSPAAITGTFSICVGAVTSLADATGGGTWSSSTGSATVDPVFGAVTGVSSGTPIITYALSGGCYSTAPVTVNPLANAGVISGIDSVCVLSSTFLSDAGSVGVGVWSISNTSIATIDVSGNVTGLAAGMDTVTFTATTASCGAASTTYAIKVNPFANAGFISGTTVLCQDSTTILTDAASGGTWSSGTPSIAVVSAGTVTGVSGGLATISYLVTNSCSSSLATADVVVNPLPNTGVITGTASAICIGATSTLTDTAMGGSGTWSSSATTIASVSATGIVTGIVMGSATISYGVTNSCGTTYATFVINVDSIPPVGDITGDDSICVGSFFTYSESLVGGVWSLSNAYVGFVSSVGTVSGIMTGIDTLLYSVTNSCGTYAASKAIAVRPLPYSGIISATTYAVCTGSAISLIDLAPSGVWSSSDTTKATVVSPGLVAGISSGTVNISYSVTNSCGTVTSIASVTVNPTPVISTITGASHICQGYTATLSDPASGGTWSSNNTGIIVIGASSGVYTAVATGTDTLTYTISNIFGCVAATSFTDTVNPTPNAGVINSIASNVCAGSTIILSDTTTGGIWSSSNTTIASVSGVTVTGVAAGSANISYTLSNSFGCSNSAIESITVNPLPVPGAIAGATHICFGNTETLTDTAAGGVWSSSNSGIISIGASSGVVTTVATGMVTITFSMTTIFGCSASVSIADTVNPSPTAGIITSTATIVCPGDNIIFIDTASGGVWSSSDSTIAIVSVGNVTGVAAGIATISYMVSNSFGCSNMAVKTVSVNPVPAIGAIMGATHFCVSASDTLTDAFSGGVWNSYGGAFTIGASSGIITAVAAGLDTVNYSITNSFGCTITTSVIDTVYALPNVGSITPMPAFACLGAVVTLTDTASGGTWSSSDTTIATVSGGAVSGLTLGIDTIMYKATTINGCMATAVAIVTVSPVPGMNTISGMSMMCVGTLTTFTDDSAGGIWSSSNSHATVDIVDGVVLGISGGIDTISYTVFNTYGCGTTVSFTDTILASPVVSPVIGATRVCLGSFIMLADSATGGTWSSLNPAIASVDTTGMVSGVALGNTAILYAVTNSAGCTTTLSILDTVNAIPTVSAIIGPRIICLGSTATLNDSTTGGIWSSSDSAVGNINPTTGTIMGVYPGVFTIVYTISNSIGCSAYATQMDTVVTAPFVPPISATIDTICLGTSTLLTDSVTGGVWSSSNAAIATISSLGWVSGTGGGTDTLYYTITGSAGCTRSTGFVMTVDSIPAVTILPLHGASICHGDSVFMSVSTADTALAYQWYVDGAAIPGATTTNYTTDTAGLFTVNITTTVGCTGMLAVTVINPTIPVVAITPGDTLYTADSFTTYQWLSSDTILSGATSNTYFETTPGYYAVIVTNQYGCIDTSLVFAVLSVTKIANNSNIQLFPNPATSVIHIDAPENVDVMVTTQEGKALMNIRDTKTINVSSLANGVYIIQLYDKNGAPLLTSRILKME